ncbi:hypothetical protein D9M71_400800 [compost metagenome]
MQGADDLLDGFAALYGGGDQGQLDLRCSAAEHADDVANHRAGGRADDADALRVSGQGELVFSTEQAFATELFLQRFEGQAQGTVAGRLDGVEDQLVVATAFEQRDLAAHLDRQAIAQGLADPRGVLAEQRAAHLGAAVLEGEVDMAGGRAGEVGDLAFDPDIAEHVFQQHPGAAVELADGQDFAVQAESFEGVFDHGLHHKGLWSRGGSGSAVSSSLARPAPTGAVYSGPLLPAMGCAAAPICRMNCSTKAPASRR